MEYHAVTKKITDMLAEKGLWFETFQHEPVRTSEEASKVRTGYTIEQGAKAIIVRTKKAGEGKFFAMFVVPGNKKFDPAKVKAVFGLSDTRFALDAEVSEITGGVLPGGIPPLGNIFNLPVYVERTLLDNEKIIFNAGDRSFSVGMKSKDYIEIVQPNVGDIVS